MQGIAIMNDHKEIMDIFKYHKEFFPHIRNDFIGRQIESGNCIYEDSVVITFNKYKKKVKLGTYTAQKGEFILHQIATKDQGSGKASKVLTKFFKFVDDNVCLTVRADNTRAKAFYEKHGMVKVGSIEWKGGELKGDIYKIELSDFDKNYKVWYDKLEHPAQVPINNHELKELITRELKFVGTMSVEEHTLFRKWEKVHKQYPVKDSNPFFDDVKQYPEISNEKDNLWVPNDPMDYMKLEPELILVDDKDSRKKRKALAFISSSMGNSKVGRGTRYIVIDKPTDKVLGLLEIGSDFLDLGGRDKYIGWSRDVKTKEKMINHTIAGRTIIPTQPLGYSYLGGKLIALLCLSDKVINDFTKKYGDIIVGVTTTSLYGSFSQYNSLAYWNKRGHSTGTVKYLPLKPTMEICKQWLLTYHPKKYYEWWVAKKPGGGPLKRDHKNRSIAFIYKELGIDKNLLSTDHKRGIYYCPIYKNSSDFLRKEINQDGLIPRFDNGFDSLVKLWKERYAKKRVEKLLKNGTFKTDILFYDDMITMSWPEIKEKYCGN